MSDGGAVIGKTGSIDEVQEQQADWRAAVSCPAKLAARGYEWDCEVLDISLGGAKLRLRTPLDPGARLSLTVEPHGTLVGRATWQDGQHLGMEFLGDPDQTARFVEKIINSVEAKEEQASYPRSSVLWSGQINAGSRSADCRILNISARGVKVRLLAPFEATSVVSLRIDRFGVFPGDIVWRSGDFLGISFRDDPADIAEIFGAAAPALRRTTG
jgi:hypothetical protein